MVRDAFKENSVTSRYLRLLNKVLNIFHELCLDKYYYLRCNKGPGFIVYFHSNLQSTREFFQKITSDFPFAFSNSRTKKRFTSYKRPSDESAKKLGLRLPVTVEITWFSRNRRKDRKCENVRGIWIECIW